MKLDPAGQTGWQNTLVKTAQDSEKGFAEF